MKKSALVLPVLLAFCLFLLPSKVSAYSGDGLGTEASPYIITTYTQLKEIEDDLSAYYKLGNDIDCSASQTENYYESEGYYNGYLPIGKIGTHPFTGELDGNGKTISSLYSYWPHTDGEGMYLGIFYGLDSAYVHDLTFSDFDISGTDVVGTLAGQVVTSRIENIQVVGSAVEASFNMAGGIIGDAEGLEIDNCSFDGTVSSFYRVGGLVGYSGGDISITDSSNDGTIYGYFRTGGLVGSSEGAATIENSHNSGGIVSLLSSYNSDSIPESLESYICVGGLIGAGWNSDISQSYNEGDFQVIGGSRSVGGLVGCGGLTDIQESYNVGDITAELVVSNTWQFDGIGGLIGMDINSVIKNSYSDCSFSLLPWTSTIVDFQYDDQAPSTGGLIGFTFVSDIENSYSNSNVDLNDLGTKGTAAIVGGLLGTEYMDDSIPSLVSGILGKDFVVRVTDFFLKIVNSFANLVLQNYDTGYKDIVVGGLIGLLVNETCEDDSCVQDYAIFSNAWWSSVIEKAIGIMGLRYLIRMRFLDNMRRRVVWTFSRHIPRRYTILILVGILVQYGAMYMRVKGILC